MYGRFLMKQGDLKGLKRCAKITQPTTQSMV